MPIIPQHFSDRKNRGITITTVVMAFPYPVAFTDGI